MSANFCKTAHTTETIIERVMTRLTRSGAKAQPTAQTVFSIVAREMGYTCTRDAVSAYTACKPVVKEMVLKGLITFHHVEGGTSFYRVPTVRGECDNGAHPVGEARFTEDANHLFEDTEHMKAGRLLASRAWTPNMKRIHQAIEKLNAGYLFEDGQWVPALDQEKARLQKIQVKAILKVKETVGLAVSFDVHCDDRGRFYVGGGYASPYAGKLNRWLWSGDDEITLDHRTSFSQILAILIGSKWGYHSGIGNANPIDFWDGVLSQWGAHVKPHTLQRKGCKAFGTPCTYGSSVEKAKESGFSLIDQSVELGEISKEEAQATKDALLKFADVIGEFSERCRNYASSFTKWGEQPYWITPSGYRSCKKYWHSTTVTWNSGENEVLYYPKSMTFTLRTGRICERPAEDSTDKSVLVATCANVVQSLDASLMAKVMLRYHAKTGQKLFPMHDAYIIVSENKDILTNIVIDVLREMVDAPEVKKLRYELGYPPVHAVYGSRKEREDMINLDMREMNPLDEE